MDYDYSVNTTKTSGIDPRQLKWDLRFLDLAKLISTWSKDPSTKVGAVLVRNNFSVASLGFNGFPQYMKDDPDLYADRETKYSRILHAEINALSFCNDHIFYGHTMYVYPFLTCDRCFVQLAQKGIYRIVAPKMTGEAAERWEPAFKRVRDMGKEANVIIDEIEFV